MKKLQYGNMNVIFSVHIFKKDLMFCKRQPTKDDGTLFSLVII